MSPSRVPEGETRGFIVPIGGAENKENDPRILERFVRVSGGADADIVVIPTASRVHESGPRYEQLFRDLGARHVAVMDFDTRRDCHEQGRLDKQSGFPFPIHLLDRHSPLTRQYHDLNANAHVLIAEPLHQEGKSFAHNPETGRIQICWLRIVGQTLQTGKDPFRRALGRQLGEPGGIIGFRFIE